MSAAAAAAADTEGDYLDYQDLTLPLDPKLIFEAPPQHFQSIVYVKRQHELLDNAIRAWIRRARECQSDSLKDLELQIALLAQGAARGADGSILESMSSWKNHSSSPRRPTPFFPFIFFFFLPFLTLELFPHTLRSSLPSQYLPCSSFSLMLHWQKEEVKKEGHCIVQGHVSAHQGSSSKVLKRSLASKSCNLDRPTRI
ncbi:hypothetical protein K457DRAFT_227163 [Linnemannia elongata AG-77]|uniref:Uncharacterized protein n=1 Tax=Linnemannia elongata AG-77 TaxID=1314771 RepID=A0A197K718_9FUNG|nr:hypothetical protein K457DRAFT_227163 [Linnemannia elongata AG-77]